MGCGSVAPFPRVGDTEPHPIPEAKTTGSAATLSVVLFTSRTRGSLEGVASLVQKIDAEKDKDSTCVEHVVGSCTIAPACEPKPPASERSDVGSLTIRDALGRTRVDLRGEGTKTGLSPWVPGEHLSMTGMGFDLAVAFPRTHIVTPAYVDDVQPLDIANGSALDLTWETSDPGSIDVVLIGHRNTAATCHFDPSALRGHVPLEVLGELRGPEGAKGWFQITHGQRATQTRGDRQLTVDAIEIAREGILRLR